MLISYDYQEKLQNNPVARTFPILHFKFPTGKILIPLISENQTKRFNEQINQQK